MSVVNQEQPDFATKMKALEGQRTGWDYKFSPPPMTTVFWSREDWLTYIGNNWFKVS